jgi:flagellar biosynthetic protein FliR
MITVTSAQLDGWLAMLLWPLARIAAVLASAPVLGQVRVPAFVQVGFALAIALAIGPALPAMPGVAPASAAGMLVLVMQIAIGLSIGFALRIVFTAVEMAGELIGLQMGLGFAVFYNPSDIQHTPVVGNFLGLLGSLTFLALNGHLAMLSALAESFRALPITADPVPLTLFETLARHGRVIFATALQLALPLIITMLVVNIALGVLTRAAPQLNIFAVGFPVTIAIGFAALILMLPYMGPLLERTLDEAFRMLAGLPSR